VGGRRACRSLTSSLPPLPSPHWPPSPSPSLCSFSLLSSNGLVFDLHANWFQLGEAADFLAKFGANTDVVLDHLGCVKLTGDAAEDA
jgi:hypothetical protein